MEQGLLDLSVELSTRDITAGNEFALFVLVKNPFNRPVWIREVNVSLPSELRLADEDKLKKELVKSDDGRWRYPLKDRVVCYQQVSEWLGEIPALCKETQECYTQLGWIHDGCNCVL